MEKQYVEFHDEGYWVAGTRVSLDSVVYSFLDGFSPETIMTDCFPTLTLEQIYGAITYYLGHRVEIDAYLKQGEAEFEAFREANHRANAKMVEKLQAARRQKLLAKE
ncbi:MAG: DUF433 domain-containing protein [Chloroflexi bacterium]|nr:DUF433 domain-containing protein [Chloroflexota bacterium]